MLWGGWEKAGLTLRNKEKDEKKPLSKGKFQENKDWNKNPNRQLIKFGSPRASSKKTRIETPPQGRRTPGSLWGPRASSKKTRIETRPSISTGRNRRSPRASSKKTRIETLLPSCYASIRIMSKGKFQENKDWNLMPNLRAGQTWGPRASSKKTRIETIGTINAVLEGSSKSKGKFQENKDWNAIIAFNDFISARSPRASSKKTRIETRYYILPRLPRTWVQGQVPRKQGLKLNSEDINFLAASRSKGKFQENKDWNYRIFCWYQEEVIVQGQVPRKQGLKHEAPPDLIDPTPRPRASSKKTRIETGIGTIKIFVFARSKGKFQENKDWNPQ